MGWLRKFLSGRYLRSDELSIALLVVTIVLNVSGLIAGMTWLCFISNIVFLLFVFRLYSRKIDRRMAENAKFMEIFRKFTGAVKPFFRKVSESFKNLCRRIQDRKTYIYLKCPGCKQNLRLPRGKGKLKVSCPKCKTEFFKST